MSTTATAHEAVIQDLKSRLEWCEGCIEASGAELARETARLKEDIAQHSRMAQELTLAIAVLEAA